MRGLRLHRLDDARAKVSRANEHLDAVREELKRINDSKPYKVTDELDGETHKYEATVSIDPAHVRRIALITGEGINALRSALDYLVWQLVLDAGNEPRRGETAFPFSWNAADFDNPPAREGAVNGFIRVQGVSDKARAKIRELQPFRARERGEPVEWHPLKVLNELVNADKHRALYVVAVRTPMTAISYSQVTATAAMLSFDTGPFGAFTGELINGAVVAHWSIKRGFEGDVNVNINLFPDICFDDPKVVAAKGASLVVALYTHSEHVRALLDDFESILQKPLTG